MMREVIDDTGMNHSKHNNKREIVDEIHWQTGTLTRRLQAFEVIRQIFNTFAIYSAFTSFI